MKVITGDVRSLYMPGVGITMSSCIFLPLIGSEVRTISIGNIQCLCTIFRYFLLITFKIVIRIIPRL